jgi:hypothetical protein
MQLFDITLTEKPVKVKNSYPVNLEEAKRHLRLDIDFDKDDDYIRSLIEAATEKCEEYIGKDLSYTENTLTVFSFIGSGLMIPEGNFHSFISAVTDASVAVPIESTEIGYNRVYVKFSNDSVSSDPLIVKYKTGYEPGTTPSLIKQAVLVKVGDLYDNERSSYSSGNAKNDNAFERLLDSYKIILY